MFPYNTEGISEGGFEPLPEGRYRLRIIKTEEKESKNGDPLVNVTLEVTEGKYENRKLFHNVTFMSKEKKGAGIAKRWLHCINEPYEGEIDVNPKNWDCVLFADVIIEEYQGKKKNALTPVLPEEAQDKATTADHGIEDEAVTGVPF